MPSAPPRHSPSPSCQAALVDEARNADLALSSAALLRGKVSIAIDHLGTRYILRATRAGKLILTK